MLCIHITIRTTSPATFLLCLQTTFTCQKGHKLCPFLCPTCVCQFSLSFVYMNKHKTLLVFMSKQSLPVFALIRVFEQPQDSVHFYMYNRLCQCSLSFVHWKRHKSLPVFCPTRVSQFLLSFLYWGTLRTLPRVLSRPLGLVIYPRTCGLSAS